MPSTSARATHPRLLDTVSAARLYVPFRSVCVILATLLTAHVVQAQAQGQSQAKTATTLSVVAYYETTAASQPAPTAITPAVSLARYRDSAAHEPGAISLTVLQDAERPSRYVVVEKWDTPAAFAQHRSAPSTQQLAHDLGPWLTNPSDVRVNTTFQ